MHVLQVYFGLGLSLQNMAGPVHINQVMGFAIEALGSGVTLLVVMRFGCRVTITYSMLQGDLAITGLTYHNTSVMPSLSSVWLACVTMSASRKTAASLLCTEHTPLMLFMIKRRPSGNLHGFATMPRWLFIV